MWHRMLILATIAGWYDSQPLSGDGRHVLVGTPSLVGQEDQEELPGDVKAVKEDLAANLSACPSINSNDGW